MSHAAPRRRPSDSSSSVDALSSAVSWGEYIKREATDIANILLVTLVALTICGALWFSPALGDRISRWFQASIACVEDTPSSKTLGDVIRSRPRCI